MGRFAQHGLYLNCTGATGNVYNNIYMSNWNSYDLGTKMEPDDMFRLEGSHNEGVVNQLNIEHTYMGHGVILNGVDNFVINLLHYEDSIPNGTYASFLYLINSRVIVNGALVKDTEFDDSKSTDCTFIRFENSSGSTTSLRLYDFWSESNSESGTPTVRFLYRSGTTTNTPTPEIRTYGVVKDSFGDGDYIPYSGDIPCLLVDSDDEQGYQIDIPALTEDTSVDMVNDYILTYDSSATFNKKARLRALGKYAATTTQTGTFPTLQLSDQNGIVTMENASPITLTVPTNASQAFPTRTEIHLIQLGAGTVTVSPDSGVTINSTGNKRRINGQYAWAKLIKTGENEWFLYGDIIT